jgi:hypothetical protein
MCELDDDHRAALRRRAVLVGVLVGLLGVSTVGAAVDVSVSTRTMAVQNEGTAASSVTIVVDGAGETRERAFDLGPGERAEPVAFREDGTYRVKLYADGTLCGHLTVQVSGASTFSAGSVTTSGGSLAATCDVSFSESDSMVVAYDGA